MKDYEVLLSKIDLNTGELVIDVWIKPVRPVSYISVSIPKPDHLTDEEFRAILQEILDECNFEDDDENDN